MKLTPEEMKGFEAEMRVIAILRSLKGRLPIEYVRRAGTKLDMLGVDVLVFLRALDGSRDIKVPIQVKCSHGGLRNFRRSHPYCVDSGVVEIIAAQDYRDEDIGIELEWKLWGILLTSKSYDGFFAHLQLQPVDFSPRKVSRWYLWRWRRWFQGQLRREKHPLSLNTDFYFESEAIDE